MEGVISVRHWLSGSTVMSFLGVREMWVAVLERKAATRGLSCAGDVGRTEAKEGRETSFQAPLLLSNRTQGSWIRTMSVVLCARWIIIIIFHFMLAAYRLWQINIHYLGV